MSASKTKTCFFRFFHDDWLRDTRPLSPAAKGMWIDFICLAWSSASSSLQASYKQFSRMLGAEESEFRNVLAELRRFSIADIVEDGDLVTIGCRRMQKDLELNAQARAFAHERAVKASLASRQKRTSSQSVASLEPASSGATSSASSELSATSATSAIVVAAKVQKPKKPPQSDESWLANLRASPAYDGIDVAKEMAKAKVWCDNNHRHFTRRFFVNWLNRAEKPIKTERQWSTPTGYIAPLDSSKGFASPAGYIAPMAARYADEVMRDQDSR